MSDLIKKISAFLFFFLTSPAVYPVWAQTPQSQFKINTAGLPILGFGDLLTFIVRLFFIIAGLAALIYGLLGGLAWITSGGDKDSIQGARDKIQAAVVGIFVLIVVLTILWTLETVIFRRSICFGISCNVRIPGLNITPLPAESCSDLCVVTNQAKGYNNGACVASGSCVAPAVVEAPTPPDKTQCTGTTPECCCTF